MSKTISITVQATINAPIEKVWNSWTSPEHITKWNQASNDWHSPRAENDLRVGGKFNTRMEAKDGSMGFDFEGVYTRVNNHTHIEYALGDGRVVKIEFDGDDQQTVVKESFDTEDENSVDLQRQGWQAILDSFKKYTEAL